MERIEPLQEGVVGLLRAVERVDPERGTPFWGDAAWWVRQAMQQHAAEVSRPAVLSDRALRQLARVRDAHDEALRRSGREPGRDELAARAGLSREQLDNPLATERAPRSVDEPVGQEEGLIGSLGELIADPLAEVECERVLEALETQELVALLSGLSDRERAVLRARYGLDGEGAENMRSVAARPGVSAERVRQIERRALGKPAAAAGAGRTTSAGVGAGS